MAKAKSIAKTPSSAAARAAKAAASARGDSEQSESASKKAETKQKAAKGRQTRAAEEASPAAAQSAAAPKKQVSAAAKRGKAKSASGKNVDSAISEPLPLPPLFPAPMGAPPLVLASASPRRLQILRQIGAAPQHIHASDIDETPRPGEHPRALAKRLAYEKAAAAYQAMQSVAGLEKALILAADTVVAVGRRVLPKAETEEEARACLRLLEGRTHKVWTAMSLIDREGRVSQRLSESRVRFAPLSAKTLDAYLASQEWQGKAGGYAIQGRAGCFALRIVGSYSGIVGLDMAAAYDLLRAQNYPLYQQWQDNPLC